MNDFLGSMMLLLVLLNPFLVIVYLIDVLEKLSRKQFTSVLMRAGVIAAAVFWVFAALGDAVFSSVVQADFASFQIFGGIVFLLIGLQFMFRGPGAIEILRGESAHITGAIAMPLLIGPGTLSASVIIGKRLPVAEAMVAITAALAISIMVMIALKALHDYVRPRNEPLVNRYIEVAGRVTALVVGTVAVQMIMTGVRSWAETL